MSTITDVTDATFATEVLDAAGPVLLDAHATWCGPCKAMAPALQAYAEATEDVKVVKLDVDQATATAQSLGIRSVPTVIVFVDGQPAARRVGALSRQALAELVASATD